jgi:integrase
MSGRLTGHVFRRTWKTKDGTEKTSWAFAIERGRVDGRRLTPITRGPFKTQKEASAALRDELTARENGTYIEPSRLTVGEWFTEVWVPSLAVAVENGTMRDSTRDLYERMVRLHISPKPFGALPIQALKTKDVTDLFTKLRTVGSPDGRGALGPGSLHNLRTVLHKGMKEAVAEEAVRRNVVALVPPPSRAGDEAEEPPHWAAGELARFLEYVDAVTAGAVVTEKRKSRKGTEYDYYRPTAPDPMLRAAFYLLAYTGMLRGEVCGLRWPQVNLKAGTAEVRGARVMVGGRAARSATKTRRGRRSRRVEPEVIQALHDWRRVQNKQRLRYGH